MSFIKGCRIDMRMGFISDAHGNPLGVAACLRRLLDLDLDSVYFLGDAVGYMPGEAEVLDLLRESSVLCQKGNHEAMLLGELPLAPARDRLYRLVAAKARLSTADLEFISSWPSRRDFEVDGKRMLLVHGSPADSLCGYVYPDSDMTAFDVLDYDVVVMGNTHRAFLARRNGRLIMNAGSCGLPRDQGNLMSLALYDTKTDEGRIIRIPFDSQRLFDLFGKDAVAAEVYACFSRRASVSVPGEVA